MSIVSRVSGFGLTNQRNSESYSSRFCALIGSCKYALTGLKRRTVVPYAAELNVQSPPWLQMHVRAGPVLYDLFSNAALRHPRRYCCRQTETRAMLSIVLRLRWGGWRMKIVLFIRR
jgi:hypothetical protein